MQTITQVAAELGVKHWHIRHALDAGYINKPAAFAGRFVFQPEDVATLRTYFTKKGANDTTIDQFFDE
jgi:hypothetical protein